MDVCICIVKSMVIIQNLNIEKSKHYSQLVIQKDSKLDQKSAQVKISLLENFSITSVKLYKIYGRILQGKYHFEIYLKHNNFSDFIS